MNTLVDAARRGDIKALKTLTSDKSININQQEERTGFTALHAATAWGNTAIVHWLLSEAKIDPNIRDSIGRRAVDIASEVESKKSRQCLYSVILPEEVVRNSPNLLIRRRLESDPYRSK